MPSPSDETSTLRPLFEGDRPDRRQWTLAIAAGVASYLDSSIIVSVGVGLVIIQKTFGLSTIEVGALSSALTFAIAVGALLGGRLSDLFGRLRVFGFDILVFAAGAAVMALSVNAPMLFVGLVIAGLAAGADLPTSVAVVSERAPAGAQGRLVSATQVMWVIGISVTQLLAFALSGTGMLGIRIIFGELVVVALITWAVRRYSPALRSLEEDVQKVRGTTDREAPKMPVRELLRHRSFVIPIALTGLFYIFWGLVANTFGQFQTYFLITAGGADQSLATGLNVALLPLSFIAILVLVRLIDTRWRNVVFVIGGLAQVLAMVIAGLGNGVLGVYVAALVAFGIGNNLSGEANYKVWTQESFPIAARATVQGFTYAVGRFVFALFALVTPAFLAGARDLLLWLLVVFSVAATALGVATFRFVGRRDPDAGPGQTADTSGPAAMRG